MKTITDSNKIEIDSSKEAYRTYIVKREGEENEEYNVEEIHNYKFSNKKLKDMSRIELMIHLYKVSNIIDKFNNIK